MHYYSQFNNQRSPKKKKTNTPIILERINLVKLKLVKGIYGY